MSIQDLMDMDTEQLHAFIRERLALPKAVLNSIRHLSLEQVKKEHLRFDMSGYEVKKGECTTHNLSILIKFADLGIFDYTHYLTLDFHKGNGILYYKYWDSERSEEVDLTGLGTCEIIHEILRRTIFSNKKVRRRI